MTLSSQVLPGRQYGDRYGTWCVCPIEDEIEESRKQNCQEYLRGEAGIEGTLRWGIAQKPLRRVRRWTGGW